MEGPCRGKRDSDARSVIAYKRNTRAPQSGEAIKVILLCVFYSVRTARSPHRHEVYKFVGPLGTGKMSLGSQLPARVASSCSESLSALFTMKLKSGATGGHMLPVGPEYLQMSYARLVTVVWYGCCSLLLS